VAEFPVGWRLAPHSAASRGSPRGDTLVEGSSLTAARSYDVLLATDCRFLGDSTSSVAEEIRAQARAGYRTGLLHVPSRSPGRPRPFRPEIRNVLEAGAAELVLPGDRVESALLVVRHPAVLADPPVGLPKLTTDRVVVAADAAIDARRKAVPYDVRRIQHTIHRLTGVTASWAPVGPGTRAALAAYGGDVPILPDDWVDVIDGAEWQVKRDGFATDRPVIGRRGHDQPSEWPRHRRDLIAAYPDDPRYAVRVLGGTDTPAQLLGRLPANWQSHPAESMPVHDFLAAIDFLVYFRHPKAAAPVSRSVLEGLAAGTVAIVPPSLEPVFGDVCLYGEPSDVLGHVDQLYGDWDSYSARSQAGVEAVQHRFGHDTHVARINGLIGAPSTAAPSPAPPPPRERGTLVVDLTRGDGLDDVVSSVVRAAVNDGGPRVVVLPAARAAELDGRVPAETFPRVLTELPTAARRAYLQRRIAGLVRTHRPARVLVVDDGHAAARDVLALTHGADTEIWHIQPIGPSAPVGDVVAEHVAAVLPREWGISRMTPRATPATRGPRAKGDGDLLARLGRALRRRSDKLAARLRRWMLSRLKVAAHATELVLFEIDDADAVLPVSAGRTHPQASTLPVTLIVVTGDYGDAHRAVRAIVERQQVTGTFRAALLAPPDWEPVASAAGLTVETLLPQSTWAALYGAGWEPYLRQRIHESCQSLGPATVVHTEGAFNRSDDSPVLLDIMESARVRRRMGREAP
jgi:hypothetical protein